MEPVTLEFATKLVKFYGCSGCWGDLYKVPDPEHDGFWLVKCFRCGDESKGCTSKKTIDRRRSESIGEAREVTRMLIKNGYVPDPLAGKSKEQKLKELGY